MNELSQLLTPEQVPEVEAELVAARDRARERPSRREHLVELCFAGSFLAAAGALIVLAPRPDGSTGEILSLGVLALVSSFAVFRVGATYTTPTQLALIPLLFVAPALAPAIIAAAFLTGATIEVMRGVRPPARVGFVLGDAWFAVFPAVVIVAAGEPSATSVSLATLAAASLAQFVGDAAVSTLRERVHEGTGLREQFREGIWVYVVDLLLLPVAFLLALGMEHRESIPLFGLMILAAIMLFARERDLRLDGIVEMSEAYRGTALVLGDVVEFDDAYTGLHTQGVVQLALGVANEMGLTRRRRQNVEFAALLHDVGKIAVPKEIINKPGPLDEREWKIIKTHTVEGERMLNRIGGRMEEIGRMVRSAHERWDGDGYPDGLSGEEIPLEARIVFCCDAFNAMTTDRSYRKGRSSAEALEELRANAGTQFDPDVVDALARVMGD